MLRWHSIKIWITDVHKHFSLGALGVAWSSPKEDHGRILGTLLTECDTEHCLLSGSRSTGALGTQGAAPLMSIMLLIVLIMVFFLFIYLKKFFLTFIYFWDRERQSMNGGGSERGRHRIWNRLQALSCQHRAWRGARTHGPRDHDLSRSRPLNRLSHPGSPVLIMFNEILGINDGTSWIHTAPD